MKRILMVIVCCCFCLTATAATIQSQGLTKATLTKINKLIASQAKTVNVGIAVQAMGQRKFHYYYNNRKRFTPASILKLYTAAAALYYLGPHFRYETDLLIDRADIKDGVLHGNVIIKFSGDPLLTQAQINSLIYKLNARGVREIEGDVILDANAFSANGYGKGWMWDELNICYAAPIKALIINRNCFNFKLVPNEQVDADAQILAKALPFTPVINNVTTVSPEAAKLCQLRLKANKDNVYELTGCIAHDARPLQFTVAIKNAGHYAQGVVNAALAQAGIALMGKVEIAPRRFQRPRDFSVLARVQSADLAVIIREMLKDSSNIMADSLVKTLGARYTKKQGTWKNGLKAIKAILTEHAKLNFKHIKMVDGSGLSRYDLTSPEQMVKLLTAVHASFHIGPEFIASLPVGGVDGTLSKRFKGSLMQAVRAKTGTMTGVGALAGYVKTKRHQTLAFVMIFNGIVGSNYPYRVLEQRLLHVFASL